MLLIKKAREILKFSPLVLALIILSACGSGNDGNTVGTPGPVGPGGYGPGGCAPLTAPIGFQSTPGSGAYVDSASVVAGTLMYPWQGSTQFGQLLIGGGGPGGQFNKTGVNGQMSLSILNAGGGGYPPGGGYPGGATIQGSIILNQQTIANISQMFGGGGYPPGGYPPGGYPPTGASVCVNQIGIDLGYSQSSMVLWGMVYLYINGQGVPLAF